MGADDRIIVFVSEFIEDIVVLAARTPEPEVLVTVEPTIIPDVEDTVISDKLPEDKNLKELPQK